MFFAVKEETTSDVLKSARTAGGASVSQQQPTVRELFEQLCVSEREEMLFIQLPDVIPGQPKNTSSPEKKRNEDVRPTDKRSPHVKVGYVHTALILRFHRCSYYLKANYINSSISVSVFS